jgi:hypothetical protein
MARGHGEKEGHPGMAEDEGRGIGAASRRCGASELHGCVMVSPAAVGSGGSSARRSRVAALLLLATAACVATALVGRLGNVGGVGQRTELEWLRRYKLEDEVNGPDSVESMREARRQMYLKGAVEKATHVGDELKDDDRIGRILARLTQVGVHSTSGLVVCPVLCNPSLILQSSQPGLSSSRTFAMHPRSIGGFGDILCACACVRACTCTCMMKRWSRRSRKEGMACACERR